MTQLMTAAIYTISASDIGGTTDTGYNIMQILDNKLSMQALYAYFKETGIFEFYEEENDRYYYQIPVEVWTAVTGIVPGWLFRITLDDGSLFYERFFNADYTDYESPDRYIYLSLNRKPPTIVKEDIYRILRDTMSTMPLIEYFREHGFFAEYEDANLYRIPMNLWEEATDIPHEIVDLLPDTRKYGSICVGVDTCVHIYK